MISTHEVNLNTSVFNRLTQSNYILIQSLDIEVNDYVLFKQVEGTGERAIETGLYYMTQVKEVITDEGLKDGYSLLVVTKLQ